MGKVVKSSIFLDRIGGEVFYILIGFAFKSNTWTKMIACCAMLRPILQRNKRNCRTKFMVFGQRAIQMRQTHQYGQEEKTKKNNVAQSVQEISLSASLSLKRWQLVFYSKLKL